MHGEASMSDDDLDLDLDLEDEEDEQPKQNGPKQLREALRRARERAKQADEFQQKAERLERELAVSRAGLSDLGEKRTAALLKVHEGDLTPEALKQTAADLGFITIEEDEPDKGEQAAEAHARASSAAQRAGQAASGQLNAQVLANWSHEKKAAFLKEFPREWEALKRGDQVTAPSGW